MDEPDVTVSLSATDTGGSNLKEIRYTTDGTAPTASSGTVYTGPIAVSSTTTVKFRAFDNAGNAEAVKSFQVNIDKTAPTISASADRAPNANGWYNDDVTVQLQLLRYRRLRTKLQRLPGKRSLGEGANQSVTKSVTDLAGNSATTR